MSFDIHAYVLVPLFIFCARIMDVSLGTIRVIFIARGIRRQAAMIGFVELMIWLLALRQVFCNLTNVYCYLAYAGGFATGTFMGMYIENLISIGKVMLCVLSDGKTERLTAALHARQRNVAQLDARGVDGPVQILQCVLQRSDLKQTIDAVREAAPEALYWVQDVRMAHKEIGATRPRPAAAGFVR